MKTITRLSLCCLALTTAVIARAQSSAADAWPGGTLGRSYSEISFGLADIRKTTTNFYDLTAAGNVPLTRHLDLGGAFGHGWLDRGVPGSLSVVSTSLTAHRRLEDGVTPFTTLGLGYQWGRAGADKWLWSAALGAQVPFGRFSFTPRLIFADDFRHGRRSSESWIAEFEGNHWLSRHTALFGTLGYTDVHRNRFDQLNWRAGLRVAF